MFVLSSRRPDTRADQRAALVLHLDVEDINGCPEVAGDPRALRMDNGVGDKLGDNQQEALACGVVLDALDVLQPNPGVAPRGRYGAFLSSDTEAGAGGVAPAGCEAADCLCVSTLSVWGIDLVCPAVRQLAQLPCSVAGWLR